MPRNTPTSPFAHLLSLPKSLKKAKGNGKRSDAAAPPFAHLRPDPLAAQMAGPADHGPAPTLAEKIERAKAKHSGEAPRGRFGSKMAAAVAKARPAAKAKPEKPEQASPSPRGSFGDRMSRAVSKVRGK